MAIDGIGDLRAELMALGALLVLVSAVPYLLDITRGRTRPRIFSWIVWTLLSAIATVAAYTEGEYPSAALTAAATVETGSIVALGWKYGNRNFERLDAYCLVGVTIGLVLWAVFHSPLVGLMAALAIDIMAAIPTVRHAWRKPREEPAAAYALCAVAALCFLAPMRTYTLMGLLYPMYSLTINTAITAIILRVARQLVWSRRPRTTSPKMYVQLTVPPWASHSAAGEVALTYGRHAAPITTGGAGIAGSPEPGPTVGLVVNGGS
jgi:hypothetical protein